MCILLVIISTLLHWIWGHTELTWEEWPCDVMLRRHQCSVIFKLISDQYQILTVLIVLVNFTIHVVPISSSTTRKIQPLELFYSRLIRINLVVANKSWFTPKALVHFQFHRTDFNQCLDAQQRNEMCKLSKNMSPSACVCFLSEVKCKPCRIQANLHYTGDQFTTCEFHWTIFSPAWLSFNVLCLGLLSEKGFRIP